MAGSVAVRKAREADALAVLACLSAAFEPYRSAYTPTAFLDTTLTPETLRQRMREMAIFVAHMPEGNIVGTISCHLMNADEGHIRGMAVLPEWQGSGAAQALLTAAEVELRAAGCHRISLDTTQPLVRAIRFYERNGFQPTGVVRDFFGMELFEYAKQIR